jgi:GrpB-like predicted nucleotidyltransferase (UPF0157 family)
MIGLEKGVVRLSPYTPEWRQLFEVEKAIIQTVVGAYILDIQHVGSTSIPGMPAKPIVDIGIAVANFEEARVCIPLIEELGYEYKGEDSPHRHYFVKGDPRTFHIHMCEISSPVWQNLLFFRDYLSQHPDVAKEYAELKLQLAIKYPQDRAAYLDGKAPFIQQVLQIATRGEL